MSYRDDRAWSDKYLPQVRNIIGPKLLVTAPMEEDTKQSTDLLVLTARDMRIGVRIRRPGFAERYPSQFTLRSSRDSGAETELSKIVNGWGDWFFYGHASEGDVSLARWMLVDLDSFRAHLIRNKNPELTRSKGEISVGKMSNGDGTHFAWFDARTFPSVPPLLIAASHDLRLEVAA